MYISKSPIESISNLQSPSNFDPERIDVLGLVRSSHRRDFGNKCSLVSHVPYLNALAVSTTHSDHTYQGPLAILLSPALPEPESDYCKPRVHVRETPTALLSAF